MGNLVTNGLILEGSGTALAHALSGFCDEPARILAAVRETPEVLSCAFRPEALVAQPDCIRKTQDGMIVDLGLAVLSDLENDYIAIRRSRDSILARMPADIRDTALSILIRTGLFGLPQEEVRDKAEEIAPGCLAAGQAAIAAYRQTGEFGWYDWRKRHWGTRAFGENVRLYVNQDDTLTARFDSVNTCAAPWIAALARANPAVQIHGAAFDADTDYAVFFVSDPDVPDGLRIMEEDDADAVRRAQVMMNPFHADNDEEPEP